ncbi:restriction endonuclease subunit S [Limosilactobacillus fermentum]|uniref:restriction endonuclease subunit S n=1 Tax=Limosilactobacillus fermentum TaxID=1613 RepID=UPI00285B0039|nr:restriction endonuclease subunit S [Limosilactobacillus fermentum]MDR7662244.1 restriction endonuclease subunit S [Limosilactobacillus fermentum]
MMVDKKRKVPNLRFKGFTDPWGERKLGDITTWTKGQGLSKEYVNNERYGSEAVHYADLYKFSPVMQEVIHWTNSDDGRIIPDNSLLFPASDVTPVGLARTSTLRLSGVKAGGDVIIGQLSERINSSFMSYQINANSKKILPLITGTTVKHVQAKSLATMSVTITNMAEQAAIAGLFERIDKLIALHQRKLDLLKEQKKGYLQKMFPKNGAKVPELRFAGFADDWEVRKLKDVLDISKTKNKAQQYGKADVLSVSREVGTVNQIKYKGRSFAGSDLSNYKVVQGGELIYTKSPLKGAPYGIFQVATIKGILSPLYAVYTSTDKAYTPFVAMALKNDNIATHYLTPLVTKGAKNTINVTDEGALEGKIQFPSILEQKQIFIFFKQLDDSIVLQHQKLAKYQSVKKSLLQQMFI